MLEPSPLRLVIGLGNPGEQYALTRHNFGFEVLDYWANREGWQWENCRFAQGLMCRAGDLRLIKPLSYMNLSGGVVRDCLNWWKLDPRAMIVVVDDINLPTGQLRLRPAGSHGGHNGLSSIESSVGTSKYARLRGGVGACPEKGGLSQHVLGRFKKEERELVEQMIERAVGTVEVFRDRGIEHAMNFGNQKK